MIRRLVFVALAATLLAVGIAAGAIYWFLMGDAARHAIEREASTWLGQPVRIGAATISFRPRPMLRLQDVQIGEPVLVTLSGVQAFPEVRSLLSRRVEVTSIALTGVRLAGHGRLVDVSADFAGAPRELLLTRLEARSGSTLIRATGRIRFGGRVEATVDARADTVDADDLLALVDAFAASVGRLPSAAPADPARITATLSAPAGSIAGVAIARLEATVHAYGRQVSIEPLAFDVFGGRQNGWFDVGIGDALDVRLGASVSNVDAAQLAAFAGSPGAVTGRFGASARLGGRGPDVGAVLESLRGAGEVLVTNGTIRGLDLVDTVVRFLGRAPQRAAGEGTAFDRIAANFAMGDALVRTDDLTLHSADFDIFGRGTLRLDTDVLDGRAQVVVSQALSSQANRTVFRYASSGDRIVLPGTISGSLAQPKVSFDAAGAVEQAIGNEIERRLSDLLDLVRGGR